MNATARIGYLERILSRSCLESSPTVVQRGWSAPSMKAASGNRTHSQLHQLKRKLLRSTLEATHEPGLFKRLCGAANHAAEEAWATNCPLLVFPCLFEEEVATVRRQHAAQGPLLVEDLPWFVPAEFSISDNDPYSGYAVAGP